MTTTRRYPRTSAEAFRGLDYSCAIERPMPMGERLASWPLKTIALAAALLLLLLLTGCATAGEPSSGSAGLCLFCGVAGGLIGAWLSHYARNPNAPRHPGEADDAGDTQAKWPSRVGRL